MLFRRLLQLHPTNVSGENICSKMSVCFIWHNVLKIEVEVLLVYIGEWYHHHYHLTSHMLPKRFPTFWLDLVLQTTGTTGSLHIVRLINHVRLHATSSYYLPLTVTRVVMRGEMRE